MGENQQGVEKLFFELASESRFGILRELNVKNWKMNDVARKLDLTTTEAFRQLQRLTETMLAQKQTDGTYAITEYGRIVLRLSAPLEFVHRHKRYFAAHEVWKLPSQFLLRLSELSCSALGTDTVASLNEAARITTEANEYMWGGGSEHPLDIGAAVRANLPKGIKYRWLFPARFIPEGGSPPEIARFVEWRSFEDMPVNIVLTEKEAGITFNLVGGKADYSGFISKDPAFIAWVKELFLYYWEKGKRNY